MFESTKRTHESDAFSNARIQFKHAITKAYINIYNNRSWFSYMQEVNVIKNQNALKIISVDGIKESVLQSFSALVKGSREISAAVGLQSPHCAENCFDAHPFPQLCSEVNIGEQEIEFSRSSSLEELTPI
jgi:hypothetical protein